MREARKRWFVLPLLLLLLAAGGAFGAGEYEVKAAHLPKFASYIQWPAGALPGGSLVIGLVGRDPSGGAIERVLQGAAFGGHRVEVRRVAATDTAALRECAMAFVDVRMPPGWDGIETILHIWKEFPDMQMVICTAYSDYSWDQIAEAVGTTDSVLILKKPFDSVEALQIAHALTRKWELAQAARRQMADLDRLVTQRTAELSATNRNLQREITERTAAEERFAKAFRSSPLPMCIQQLETGLPIDVNSSYETLLGYSRAELLAPGSAAPEIWLDPATPATIRTELSLQHTVRGLAASVRKRDGEQREALVSAEQFILEGEPHMLLILQDITERGRLEAELRQAQKMEAVGQLAAGIAHDFNNLLTVILGNTSLQLHTGQLGEKVAHSLQQVVRAADRATVLTRQLLAYSRKQIIQRRPIDLNDAAEQNFQMLHRLIGEHISIETELTPDLPAVHADPASLDQILMNLTLNARDAMPEGGRIILRTGIEEITSAQAVLHPEARPGTFARLSLQDTGSGMDAATLGRIFEPFFTTKEQGKGTGMGLATVYGIVKQHDGWITVESAPRRGTEFCVYLPIAQASTEAEPAAVPPAIPSATGCADTTILVVEDEEMLREYLKEVLEADGYRVLVAEHGVAALDLWERENGQIDMLLTDVVMPESISGWRLAQCLTERKPELKVILISGYSPDLIRPEFEQHAEHCFLPKPFLADQLSNTVASCLRPALAAGSRGPALVPGHN